MKKNKKKNQTKIKIFKKKKKSSGAATSAHFLTPKMMIYAKFVMQKPPKMLTKMNRKKLNQKFSKIKQNKKI